MFVCCDAVHCWTVSSVSRLMYYQSIICIQRIVHNNFSPVIANISWQGGKVSGTVYHGADKLTDLVSKVMCLLVLFYHCAYRLGILCNLCFFKQ